MITEIPDCTVELMFGNTTSRAVSAVVTAPDLEDLLDLARLAHGMVVRVPGHASRTGVAFRRVPRLRWFQPRESTLKAGGKGVWGTAATGKGSNPWSQYTAGSTGSAGSTSRDDDPPRAPLTLRPDRDLEYLDGWE